MALTLILSKARERGRYIGKAPYAAKITSYDSQYTFKREFLTPIKVENGGVFTFEISEDGAIYETKNRGKVIAYWTVQNGDLIEVAENKVKEQFIPYFVDKSVVQIKLQDRQAVGSIVTVKGKNYEIIQDDSYSYEKSEYHEDPESTRGNAFYNDFSHYSTESVEVYQYFARLTKAVATTKTQASHSMPNSKEFLDAMADNTKAKPEKSEEEKWWWENSAKFTALKKGQELWINPSKKQADWVKKNRSQYTYFECGGEFVFTRR